MQKLFLEKFLKAIRKYSMIVNGDRIVIALSGGPDSVALLYSLSFIREKYSLELYSIHINHCIRGEEALRDENFSVSISKKFDIPCKVIKVDVPAKAKELKISEELAGRQVRYEEFNKYAEEVKATKIATAHHADDRTETIFMRIIRGTGSIGFAGILPVRENFYIRPLIDISKSEILNLLSAENLSFCEDKTNNTSDYFRNKVRNEIIPIIKTCNPNINKNIADMTSILLEEGNFISKIAESEFLASTHEKEGKIYLDILKIKNLHLAILRAVIRIVFMKILKSSYDVDFDSCESVISLIDSEVGKKIILRDITVLRDYNFLIFSIKKNDEKKEENFLKQIFENGIIIEKSDLVFSSYVSTNRPDFILKGGMTAVFDYDKISFPIYLRFRKNGDYFMPFGMKGKKKLKDFFSDEKVPLKMRDKIPLLVDSCDKILWVTGFRISDQVKVTDFTKKYFIVLAEKK